MSLDILSKAGCLSWYKEYSYLFIIINKFTEIGFETWRVFCIQRMRLFLQDIWDNLWPVL